MNKMTKRLILTALVCIAAVSLSAQICTQCPLLDSTKIEEGLKFKDFLAPECIYTLIIALVGAVWAIVQSRNQKANTRAEVYNHFQEKFKEFQSKLPEWINERDENGKRTGRPKDEKEWRIIESYWWLVFDEWVVCLREAKSCKSLWDNYYSKGVQNALESDFFEEALHRLVKRENSFLGHDDEFRNDVNILYKEKYGIELFSRINDQTEHN